MTITESDRELIERALDMMAVRSSCGGKLTVQEIRLYEAAVAVVRERPAGQRRLRRDFLTQRPRELKAPLFEPASIPASTGDANG